MILLLDNFAMVILALFNTIIIIDSAFYHYICKNLCSI